jgi:hypothetical protein
VTAQASEKRDFVVIVLLEARRREKWIFVVVLQAALALQGEKAWSVLRAWNERGLAGGYGGLRNGCHA